ncbi:MAG: UDP-3-O-(3-hydroxymyristoyl)glucosamine N-acyltransferase [Ectothiorhodospiraceae bacterium]|nr:UDP-3-O-(3-hydroxymyristoyl)glucosamine N-acyltransferase [Ectothiorhodospiraceae bacterium]MCH8505246.1 UDP-3-O-(3-hydroxymyristoyl)glucosamine N-acyltransferase [Ectothiorhodospiraceae bacterium]
MVEQPSRTLGELAELVGAQLFGDAGRRIRSVGLLGKATGDEIGFCASARYLDQLRSTGAGAAVVREEHSQYCPTAALVVDDPYYAYAAIASALHPRERAAPGVHPSAIVASDAILEAGVAVGPHAVIGAGVRLGRGTEVGPGTFIGDGTRLGEDCWLANGVSIGADCSLGDRVMIHPGVIIGADGFGFAPGPQGWRKVPQLGAVRIGDDVDIGANSTIDRGALEDTVIGPGVKIDNLVHIAHNVHIGERTVIAGCTVVAGSTTIGSNCVIGGASAITGHIQIVDGATVTGMTGVTNHIREPGVYSSPLPAQPVREWRRNTVRFTQLDDMFRRVIKMERELEAVTGKQGKRGRSD